jgi:hypothetical protein
MRGLGSVAALLAVLFVLSACATPEIPYDRTEAAQIKTIGIVTPRFPDGASVVLASSIGQSFGLIGALVDAGMEANRESEFKTAVAGQNFAAADAFLRALSDGLRAQGYSVTIIPATRESADFLDHYPPAHVDAYLDVVVQGYGYIAAGISKSLPYRPIVAARARLVKAQDNSALMEDTVVYNPYGSPPKAVTIAPVPQEQFADFDALIADPNDAVAWLHNAIDKSALAIDQLLSPTL